MRHALLLALLAAPVLAQDAPRISYKKSVMLDPAYRSSWSQERIAQALQPPPRVVVEYVEVERAVPVYRESARRYEVACESGWRVSHRWGGCRYRDRWDHPRPGCGYLGYARYSSCGPCYGHYGYGSRCRSTFPAFTILAGAAGGIIGHQSRETGAGIAIGAGVGLLADVLASR
jgi:hypothetical protein